LFCVFQDRSDKIEKDGHCRHNRRGHIKFDAVVEQNGKRVNIGHKRHERGYEFIIIITELRVILFQGINLGQD
jgi:hypothetical protein